MSSGGRLHFVLLLAAMGLLITACGGGQTELPTGEEPPDWITSIQPGPGARMTSAGVVEVTHDLAGPNEGVRLIIDGVDVTKQAQTTGGNLHYSPDLPGSTVPLEPGAHTAEVQRVRLEEFGEKHEVLETFEWSFTVQ